MSVEASNESFQQLELSKESLEEVQILCRDNPSYFGALGMPHVFHSEFPEFYVQVWKLLVQKLISPEEAFYRFSLGLPRGHAKTTFVKLFAAYCIQHDLVDMVLVICASEDRAQNIAKDISEILGSPNMEAIYGPWSSKLEVDNAKMKIAKRRNKHQVIISAGVESSIRGINIMNYRPQLIIMDDVQTNANAASEAESSRLLKHIVGTILKARDYKKCLAIYIANLVEENCILQKFRENSQWTSLITGAILDDGSCLWPEITNLASLKADYLHDAELGLADTWFAEVQNMPKQHSIERISAISQLAQNPPQESTPLASYITIDPATGAGKDSCAIIVHQYFTNGLEVVAAICTGNFSIDEIVFKTVDLALKFNVGGVFPEGVAFQVTLSHTLQKALRSLELDTVLCEPIYPGKQAKNQRILAWMKQVIEGKVYVAEAQDRALIFWQARWFRPENKSNKDDILDAASMSMLVRNKYPEYFEHCVRFAATPQDDWVTNYSVFPNVSALDTRKRLTSFGR